VSRYNYPWPADFLWLPTDVFSNSEEATLWRNRNAICTKEHLHVVTELALSAAPRISPLQEPTGKTG